MTNGVADLTVHRVERVSTEADVQHFDELDDRAASAADRVVREGSGAVPADVATALTGPDAVVFTDVVSFEYH